MEHLPPFEKQAPEAAAVEEAIASPEDIEESLIKSLGSLSVEHAEKARREKESIVDKKPETEAEWRDLCVKRCADTDYVIANDFSIKNLLPVIAGGARLSYELFY